MNKEKLIQKIDSQVYYLNIDIIFLDINYFPHRIASLIDATSIGLKYIQIERIDDIRRIIDSELNKK